MTDTPRDPFTNDQGIPSYVLPYEGAPIDAPPGALGVLGDVVACGHCDFSTAVLDTPFGMLPVLTFRFTDATMRPLAPVSMVLDVDTMQGFKEQLVRAINDGIRKAKARQ